MALKIDRRLSNIGKILGWVLVAVIVVVLAKVFIWEQTYYRDKSKEPRAKADVVVTQIETIIAPAEFEPTESEIAEYQVREEARQGEREEESPQPHCQERCAYQH